MSLDTDRGFSLIEILIAVAISSIMITAIYQLFHSQKSSYLIQDQVAEMQQNLRAGLFLMTKEIRSAGYDPTSSGNFGFVSDFAAPNDILSTNIDYATDSNIIAFTIDDDEQGDFDANDNELIAYRLNTSLNTLERYMWTDNAWKTVATNVDALDFVYLDANGNVTTTPGNFQAVQLTLLVRTGNEDAQYNNTEVYLNKQGDNICSGCTNDHHRHRLLSTTIRIRN